MYIKQTIYQQLLQTLNQQIDRFQFALDELSNSVMNETKSTAGDKHETALAMLQSEQSRIAQHLYEAVDRKTVFVQLNVDDNSESVRNGSVIKTNKGYFFMGVAITKTVINDISIIGISPQSPLGKELSGHKKDDIITVNGNEYLIEDIL